MFCSPRTKTQVQFFWCTHLALSSLAVAWRAVARWYAKIPERAPPAEVEGLFTIFRIDLHASLLRRTILLALRGAAAVIIDIVASLFPQIELYILSAESAIGTAQNYYFEKSIHPKLNIDLEPEQCTEC